jgi:hypothetical protein
VAGRHGSDWRGAIRFHSQARRVRVERLEWLLPITPVREHREHGSVVDGLASDAGLKASTALSLLGIAGSFIFVQRENGKVSGWLFGIFSSGPRADGRAVFYS